MSTDGRVGRSVCGMDVPDAWLPFLAASAPWTALWTMACSCSVLKLICPPEGALGDVDGPASVVADVLPVDSGVCTEGALGDGVVSSGPGIFSYPADCAMYSLDVYASMPVAQLLYSKCNISVYTVQNNKYNTVHEFSSWGLTLHEIISILHAPSPKRPSADAYRQVMSCVFPCRRTERRLGGLRTRWLRRSGACCCCMPGAGAC